VKRKQRELLTDSEIVKLARSCDASADENVLTGDESMDRSVEDTAAKTSQLQMLLEHERKQSDDFEAYLRQVLCNADCETTDRCTGLTQQADHDGSDRQYSLTEKLSHLQSTLASEREAARLFELQLLHCCLYD